jgi:hypothetical protein
MVIFGDLSVVCFEKRKHEVNQSNAPNSKQQKMMP